MPCNSRSRFSAEKTSKTNTRGQIQVKIIALSGWKRSGKDTVAQYLTEVFGAKRKGFADPLKDAVAREYGLDRQSIDDPTLKEAPILSMPVSPRDAFSRHLCEFMVKEFRSADGATPDAFTYDKVGEFHGVFGALSGVPKMLPLFWTRRSLCILKGSTMRTADPDYWVKNAVKEMREGSLYVISDVRYQNEVNALKATGAEVITVRIDRFESTESEDPSERDLDAYSFDYRIDNRINSGISLRDVFNQTDEILLKENIRAVREV